MTPKPSNHVPIDRITISKRPIHAQHCRCHQCEPDESIWPSHQTGILCLLIAIAGIAINLISFS